MERLLQLLDLRLQQLDLVEVAPRLQRHQLREVGHVAHVHLLQEPSGGVQRADAALDQREPRAQHVTQRAELVGDHMSFR